MKAGLTLALGGLLLANAAWAEGGDPEAGRKIAGMCRTCHGMDGYARIPIAPHIGGEPAAYLETQLMAFKTGARVQEMMSIVTQSLSATQIADVSAWYASHEVTATLPEGVDPADAPQGCVSCHGAVGLSLVEDAPNLAGETNIYIDTQLKAFRLGKRQNSIMNEIAQGLSDAEIRAVSDWFASIAVEITPSE